jgi:hypothetical protein
VRAGNASVAERSATLDFGPWTLDRVSRYQLTQRPVLQVWYCRTGAQSNAFINDYKTDPQFRGAIDAAFAVQWIDHDQHPILSALGGVCRTPYFYSQAAGLGFSTYTGKAWLLCKLQLGPVPVAGASGSSQPETPQAGAGVPPTSSSDPATSAPGVPFAPAPVSPSRSSSTPSPPAPASGASGQGLAPGPAAGVDDPLVAILRQMSDLKSALEGVQQGQKTLGQSDPKLSAIIAKLGDLDDLAKTIEGIDSKIPQPVDQLLKQGAQDAAQTLFPGLIEQVGSKLAPLLGGAGAAGSVGGLAGILATIGATVGLGPVGTAVGLGMALLGIIQLIWKRLVPASGSITLPQPLQQLAALAPSLLGSLQSLARLLPGALNLQLGTPAAAASAPAPGPTVIAQPQNAPYPVSTMADAYQAAYQQFLKGSPDNATIQILTNFDNLVQQHINARTTQNQSA